MQDTFFWNIFKKMIARGEMKWPLALRGKQMYLMFVAAPCFCVEASGSMKGGARGHLRHLLPPRTTHQSICIHCRPSVHLHRLTDKQKRGQRDTLPNTANKDTWFWQFSYSNRCLAQNKPHLTSTCILGWRKVSSFIMKGTTVSAKHGI